MICHGFKGGIGTASRLVHVAGSTFTVGVLVQANHGSRKRLSVLGVPIGEAISERESAAGRAGLARRAGSIIGVVGD